ncbi:MAG: nitroreductase family protein [Dysgonamonadaceae bacterium]|jgi:nitroreductase|nr:nitroreductase family protein [Dysgonamonadaceae bacterium]
MNEIIKNMLERRSIRKYKPEQIAEETLNVILLAGTYAPSAGGRQSPVIVACQDAGINDWLGKINKAAFRGHMSSAKSYISKEQPSIADDVSLESGFYGAPTVLTLFAPGNFLYSVADCSVAAQNIVLAAHSLGIGSCIVARAEDTFASELGQRLQKEWSISSDYEAKIHITLGYPANDAPPKAKPRKEERIIRVF